MEKILKYCSFGTLALIVVVLAAATVLEKFYGTAWSSAHLYGTAWFALLWTLAAVSGAAYIGRRGLAKQPAAFLLHLALLVVVAGAGITRVSGLQGTVHLRTDKGAVFAFTDRDGREHPFPFGVELLGFRVERYPGTDVPMDFESRIRITEGTEHLEGVVSMNRIFVRSGYRLYQSGYDPDRCGTILAVSHDPWGIGVTYAGYALLGIAMMLFAVDRRSGFRRLLRSPLLKRASFVLLFATAVGSASAADGAVPPALPRETARELGGLYVYYNGRICPLETLAHEFTAKLCGRSRYGGLTAEQVLSGWLFYYDDWKHEPMIRIRSAGVRRRLGAEGRRVCLSDFHNVAMESLRTGKMDRATAEADEKFRIVGMLCSGGMLRIFPYTDPTDGSLRWASLVDDLPRELPHEQRVFIRSAMNYVNELVVRRDFDRVAEVLHGIRAYQEREAGEVLPAPVRFRAERLYHASDFSRAVAMALVAAGFAVCALQLRRTVRRSAVRSRTAHRLCMGVIVLGFAFLTLRLALRGCASGHWPLSNGYETMQFLAWCVLSLTLCFGRRFRPLWSFGALAAGLALLVSTMGESNPQITPLIPVLDSPLLSIHVALVMFAYALLLMLLFNAATGLLLCRLRPAEAVRMQLVGRLLLYPALFALTAGIFVGAVWANISWGRYWGWDPKEVWALVTLLVYAAPLHAGSLPWFRRADHFHAYCVAAFLSVLVTYFGVNLLLGGLHSYAG